jgi:hypothetical protein
MWERDDSLASAVEEAWSRRIATANLGDVHSSLRMIMNNLYSWKASHFGSVPKEIEKKRKLLEAVSQLQDPESECKKLQLSKEMDERTADSQNDIKSILKYETTCFEEKYLGLPVPEGRMKKGKLQSHKERFLKRASDWIEKYMSGGAKEILIKAVLQSLPTYAMGIFKFPVGLLDELSHIIRDFWWGDEHDRRRIHWMSWEKMTRPKSHGGMGFRDLRVFNQALLARQAWRLLHFPESLCARVLKAKYYPAGNLLDTAFIQNTSQSWQGVMHGLELLKKGAIWLDAALR